MIILRLLLLLTNLHLKLLSKQGTGAAKLLSTQRVKLKNYYDKTKHPKYFLISTVLLPAYVVNLMIVFILHVFTFCIYL